MTLKNKKSHIFCLWRHKLKQSFSSLTEKSTTLKLFFAENIVESSSALDTRVIVDAISNLFFACKILLQYNLALEQQLKMQVKLIQMLIPRNCKFSSSNSLVIKFTAIKNTWQSSQIKVLYTAWKVTKYGVFFGPYFPVFGPEKTPYLDTFHAVIYLFRCMLYKIWHILLHVISILSY